MPKTDAEKIPKLNLHPKTYSWNPYQPWSEKGLCPWLIHSSSLGSTAGRWNPLVFPLKRWWFRRLNFSVVCQPTKCQFPESITYQIVATAGPKLRPCSFICRIICIMSCNCLSFSHAHLCWPQVPMIFQNIVPKDQGRFDYNFMPMWLKDITRNQINHLFVGVMPLRHLKVSWCYKTCIGFLREEGPRGRGATGNLVEFVREC